VELDVSVSLSPVVVVSVVVGPVVSVVLAVVDAVLLLVEGAVVDAVIIPVVVPFSVSPSPLVSSLGHAARTKGKVRNSESLGAVMGRERYSCSLSN
jgi:hypothetical protein